MSSYILPDGKVPILISASTASLLKNEVKEIKNYLETYPTVGLTQISEMLFRTRSIKPEKVLISARNKTELCEGLKSIISEESNPNVIRNSSTSVNPNICFVFPGQGNQRPGMGKVFYSHSPIFKSVVDECDLLFRKFYGSSPMEYLLDVNGKPTDDLRIIQPALFMQMIAIAEMWKHLGITPKLTVGHSQGEISAAYISGLITLEDAIKTVKTRADIVTKLPLQGCAMGIIGSNREECELLISENSNWAELSVINSPNIIGISGTTTAVSEILAAAAKKDFFTREIKIKYPAHSSKLAPFKSEIAEGIAEVIKNKDFLPSKIPLLGATFGREVSNSVTAGMYWFLNFRNKVRFDLAIVAALNKKTEIFIEMSEYPVLQLAMQENINTYAADSTPLIVSTSKKDISTLETFSSNFALVALQDQNFNWEKIATNNCNKNNPPLFNFPNSQMNKPVVWMKNNFNLEEIKTSDKNEIIYLQEVWQELNTFDLANYSHVLIINLNDTADLNTALAKASKQINLNVTLIEDVADISSIKIDSIETVVLISPSRESLDSYEVLDSLGIFFEKINKITDNFSHKLTYILITFAGERVTETDSVSMFNGAISAGFRCLGVENINNTFKHIDIIKEKTPIEIATTIIDAIQVKSETELAIRNSQYYVKRIVKKPEPQIESELDFNKDNLENIIITGGTGKIGLEVCEYLAKNGAKQIVLLSRSGLNKESAIRIEDLKSKSRTNILIHQCDISSLEEVQNWYHNLNSPLITGIVHAAVNHVPVKVKDINKTNILTAAGAKIIGIKNILQTVELSPAGRVLLFSSFAATFAGIEQVLYALTNKMLDVLALELQDKQQNCVSIQWGLWEVQGVVPATEIYKLEKIGLLPMDPVKAIELGLKPKKSNSIILAANWNKLISVLEEYGFKYLFTNSNLETANVSDTNKSNSTKIDNITQKQITESKNIADLIIELLVSSLGIKDVSSINPEFSLVALGLDSLQALDFQTKIKEKINTTIPLKLLLGGAKLKDVVNFIDKES